jgi:hypothetical protein
VIEQDLFLPESHHSESMGLKKPRPRGVPSRLPRTRVLRSVKLDDESLLDAAEVRDESCDRVLAAKLDAAESSIAEGAPEETLGEGCSFPEDSCTRQAA